LADRIKGITVEIGGETSGLDKALKGINQSSRSLQSELRDVQRLLKFDPGNATLLAQEQELLGNQIENTEKKLKALRDAEAQVAAQFKSGEIGAKQFRAFQRELQATEGYLSDLKNKIDTVDDSKAPENAAEDIEKIDKAAQRAKDSLAAMGRGLNTAAKGIAGAAGAAAGAIGGLVIGTQEFNMELGRLRFNAFNEGFDVDIIEKDFQRLAAITGETDSAIETMANLMQTGFDQQQMSEAVDLVNGAYLRFSDTLKTEGIADGIQETFATGKAIGPFAELLERSGVNLDTFNAGLAEATKNGTETNFVLQTMRDIGLEGTTEGFRKMNSEIVAQQEAQLGLQMALAELGVVLTPVLTLLTNFATKVAEWTLENVNLVTSFDSIAEGIVALLPTLMTSGLQMITTIVTAIVENLPMIVQTGSQILVQLITGIIQMLPSLVAQIQTMLPMINSIIQQNLPIIIAAGVDLLLALIDGIIEILPQLLDTALNIITLVAMELLKHLPQIVEAGIELLLALIKGILNILPKLDSTIANDIIPAIVDTLAAIDEDLRRIGKDIIQGLIDGIWSKARDVWDAAKNIASGIGQKVASILELGSPSKVLIGMGEDTGKGFEIGLDRSINNIQAVAGNMGRSFIDSLTGFFGGTDVVRKYFEAIQEDGDYLNDWLTHMPKNMREAVRQVGKAIAPMLEGMDMSKIFQTTSKNVSNTGETLVDSLTGFLGGGEVLHKYFQAIQEDGDYLNDWLTHMPKNIADMARKIGKSLAPMLEGTEVDRTFTENLSKTGKSIVDALTGALGGTDVIHDYFEAIQEDGDWLNDWLTEMPKHIANVARQLGNVLAPKLEGMTVDRTNDAARNMVININSPKALNAREAKKVWNRTMKQMQLQW
jgi:hypothetical protein